MKKNVIVSLADANYYPLLDELINSVKRFKDSENVAVCILDAGLTEDQKKSLSSKVDEIKSAEWDIEVPDYKVKGKEWLKSQVSRAFLPNYFPNYEKYLWIDCDAWVNDWRSVELYFKACENGKLGITQTIGPGYKITSKVNWLFGKIAIIKSQNFKHAVKSKIGFDKANLFKSEKDEKINSLMRSIDNTNHRYGRSTLSVASAGVHKKWNMRRQYSSKIDTADFYCLPTIRA